MKQKIKLTILKYFENKKLNVNLENIQILSPVLPEKWDFSTNVAMVNSKNLKINHIELANGIKDFLNKNNKDIFKEIEVSKQGFINFLIKDDVLSKETISSLENIISQKRLKLIDKKINYEFVSANPTGFLHVGHARNAIVGDITCNLIKYLGGEVIRDFYVNDAGEQIKNMGKSVLFYYQKLINKQIIELKEEELPYKGKDIKEAANFLFSNHKDLIKIKDSKKLIEEVSLISKEFFLKKIKETLEIINIKPFDNFISEKELISNKKVEEVLKKLKQTKYFYEKDGANWLETTKYGDDKDRVLIKKDQNLTYMVPDLANHVGKFERGFDEIINLWGKDHHGYEKRIKIASKILGYNDNKIKVFYISMVKVFQQNKELKMSKREGTSLQIIEVLKEMNKDLLRYSIINKSKDQGLIIDIENIKKEDMSNPYFYTQYVNARINSLQKKYLNVFKTSEEIQLNEFKKINKYNQLSKDKQERKLILALNDFKDVLIKSYIKNEPSIIWNYIMKLSINFHSYYNSCIIIHVEKQTQTKEKMKFVLVFQQIFKILFSLLGINILEQM